MSGSLRQHSEALRLMKLEADQTLQTYRSETSLRHEEALRRLREEARSVKSIHPQEV